MMVPHIDMAVGDTFKMSSKSHSPFLLHEPNHLLNDCRKTPVGLRRHLRSSRNSWRQKKGFGSQPVQIEVSDPWGYLWSP